ncbi:ABC transporter ATP-binding protein [Microbacterium schleiferi]|uniref:ABC transporter ATP-binding protein n=1 Tax=Microbacterium schleiferi TaxID=69362 RepID=A0A7S8MW99_9MICO|nr:ABC transporter ATP-binding protein [Microbacterium schleiferi]QPE04460.1 ABC transporter ATP-binding protein [Microbacterium schleiferi]
MTPAIELNDLRKQYGRQTALHGLTLSVAPGTVFGLIGPNGAGKTTTLRMLVDIIRPTSGTARVLGTDPRTGGAALRRRIGYVPGELRMEGRTTGRRLLDFYASVSGPVRPSQVNELAERLSCDLTRPVRTLSKGNKQKLGLIQAFMHEPPLLILDEPTSGLDPLVQREFLNLVHEARQNGQTVLLSSHVLSEIQQAADEVAVLSEGRVVAAGAVDELRLGAVRRVRAVMTDADPDAVRSALAPLSPTAAPEIRAQDDRVIVHSTIEGDVDPLVKALARFHVAELLIEEPDLEESVLRLYGPSRPAASPTGGE